MEKNKRKSMSYIYKLYNYLDNIKILRCIRGGLILMIPIILVGAFALVATSLPIPFYQTFIDTFLSGAIKEFFNVIYQVTFGVLAVYMTISVALCYTQQNMSMRNHNYGAILTSLICFFIFSGLFSGEGLDISVLGPQGIFNALFCALVASYLYDKINHKMRLPLNFFAEGTDEAFKSMLFTIFPIAIVAGLFSLVNLILSDVFEVTGFQMLFTNIINNIFENLGRSLGTALLFEVLLNLFWFFGIHGNDVLESVCQNIFVPAIEVNQELLGQGLEATEIYSKTFFDVFVTMGGCGSALCLMLAVLIFAKRKSNRSLAKIAAVPIIFNINEIIVFGLPIVFNPMLLIPFLLTPVVLVLVSTLCIQCGFVPVPINSVEWTTPVLLGGYLATGSIAGSVLQVINIFIGVCIYAPFVRLFERVTLSNANTKMNQLVERVKTSEELRDSGSILSLHGEDGVLARSLAEELVFALRTNEPKLYYQPQYDNTGKCIGVEALLRWKHSLYGMVYPPLALKLAEESDVLLKMEKGIFENVCKDMKYLCDALGEDTKVSINVTGKTIQSRDFEAFLQYVSEKYAKWCKNIMIEITEQDAIAVNDDFIERIERFRKLGFSFAIDDFSMGSTSIKYLQTNLFSMIKLDGGLSKDIINNDRSREIIASITKLSKEFDIKVIAEFVETEEQRAALEEVGCIYYQGYLYSPAVELSELEEKADA